MASFLRNFDAFPKTDDEFRKRTSAGAVVTIMASVVIMALFTSELSSYLQVHKQSDMYVDTSLGERLTINFDFTFPAFPCAAMHLDAMDISGYQQLDLDHDIFKQRLNPDGEAKVPKEKIHHGIGESKEVKEALEKKEEEPGKEECQSCYGAGDTPEMCCNTCAEVRAQYRKKGWSFDSFGMQIKQCIRDGYVDDLKQQVAEKEGCNMHGQIKVQKVAGNFHFGVGRNFQQASMHVHDLMPLRGVLINLTHYVNHLSFGVEYPGAHPALDGSNKIQTEEASMYQYFVKVVPTTYQSLNGSKIRTNQYSVTDYQRPLRGGWDERGKLPGVFVFYDVSPIMVHYSETRTAFTHFLTEVCAIVGGAVTVTGMLDKFIYSSHNAWKRKMQIGKLG